MKDPQQASESVKRENAAVYVDETRKVKERSKELNKILRELLKHTKIYGSIRIFGMNQAEADTRNLNLIAQIQEHGATVIFQDKE